jgi:hypothetical protein
MAVRHQSSPSHGIGPVGAFATLVAAVSARTRLCGVNLSRVANEDIARCSRSKIFDNLS